MEPSTIQTCTQLLSNGWSYTGGGLVSNWMGDLLGKLSCCWKWCWWNSRGWGSLWANYPQCPIAVMGTASFRCNIKLGCWHTVAIKGPMTLSAKCTGFPGVLAKFPTLALSTCHQIIPWSKMFSLSLHLSWCVASVVAQKNVSHASPRWVLHIGGGCGQFTPHYCNCFECLEKENINVVIYPRIQAVCAKILTCHLHVATEFEICHTRWNFSNLLLSSLWCSGEEPDADQGECRNRCLFRQRS